MAGKFFKPMPDYNGYDHAKRSAYGQWQMREEKALRLQRPKKCLACGFEGVCDGHAEDYAKAFDPATIYPLCFICHYALHYRGKYPAGWKRYARAVYGGYRYNMELCAPKSVMNPDGKRESASIRAMMDRMEKATFDSAAHHRWKIDCWELTPFRPKADTLPFPFLMVLKGVAPAQLTDGVNEHPGNFWTYADQQNIPGWESSTQEQRDAALKHGPYIDPRRTYLVETGLQESLF